MSNYNSTLQSNNTDLQEVLQILQNKAANSGGEQATPVISVDNSTGIITATAGAKSSTYQLAFQSAKTITPTTTSQIAVSSGYYTGGNITVKGDANLVAENIKNGVSIFGITGDYEGSGGSSGEPVEYSENEDAMINDTLSVYSNDRVRTIRVYAFARCYSLTSVSFPLVTSIGSSAFYHCYNLTSASFPQATTIGGSAFGYCSSLTSVSVPLATYIGAQAFAGCSKLTSVSFPQATTIGYNAFAACYSLTSVSFPLVTTIDGYAFFNCSSLTSVSFPLVTTISGYAFYNCIRLTSLYLTGSSVCKLTASTAFTLTPIEGSSASTGTYGSIYVPTSLLTQYQSATNWAYFSSRFVGI